MEDLRYTLRSDADQLRITSTDTISKLLDTRLTLLARDGIDLLSGDDQTDDKLVVRSAEVGGVRNFTVTQDLLSKLDITGDPNQGSEKTLVLRAGAGGGGTGRCGGRPGLPRPRPRSGRQR